MRVFTFKANKKTIFATLMAVTAVVAIAIAVIGTTATKTASTQSNSIKASTDSERIAFLAQYSWEVKKEVAEVREVVIPQEFNDVYQNYNKIQLEQGFDLTKYQGRPVKRWTYTVTNYPGYENTDFIKANILVFDGQVIGGDICSTELDGFMHTFKTK